MSEGHIFIVFIFVGLNIPSLSQTRIRQLLSVARQAMVGGGSDGRAKAEANTKKRDLACCIFHCRGWYKVSGSLHNRQNQTGYHSLDDGRKMWKESAISPT